LSDDSSTPIKNKASNMKNTTDLQQVTESRRIWNY